MVINSTNIASFMEIYDKSLEESNFQSLKFQNVTKKFKSVTALNNVSFELRKGDILGYIGPNGAGKTTTIKIMVGLIKDFIGDYFINDVLFTRKVKNFNDILGYHPQDAGFQTWRTVNHTLYTFGRLSGIEKNVLIERIQSILKFVELYEFKDKKIKYLSGGMIQKLRLAQALLNLPKILILDEPLSGLDPASRYQIKSLIKFLAQKEITILFSSHILNDVEDVANKIGIINRGQILKIDTPTQLQEQFQVGKIIEIIYANDSSLCRGLKKIKEIEKVEIINNLKQLIHLRHDIDIDAISHKILELILQQKSHIRSFRVLKPSLENIYLKYIRGDKP